MSWGGGGSSVRRAQRNYRNHERRQMRDGERIYKMPPYVPGENTRHNRHPQRQTSCLLTEYESCSRCGLTVGFNKESQVSQALAVQPSGHHPFSRYCCLSLIRRTRRRRQRAHGRAAGPPQSARVINARQRQASEPPRKIQHKLFSGCGRKLECHKV